MAVGAAAAATTILIVSAAPGRRTGAVDLLPWIGIVVFVTAMLLRLSWPALVPPGRGPDLTHHLLLVDYIETEGHLVHDRSLDGSMGEMAHYTPGSHLLAVIAGQWLGVGGLRAFFPLVVACAALAAGFVFLIARRLDVALPFAVGAVVLLFLPAAYFIGGFTHEGYLSQAVATMFAVAAWWALAAWRDHPASAMAWVIAILLAALYLSWPMFLGPLVLVFLALLMASDLPRPARQRHLGIVVVPLIAIFLLHSWDRWGWMVIVRTSGAVVRPSLDSIGWLLPLLAVAGAFAALSDRRARLSAILLFVIALQAVTLFVIAASQGASTPYMALKMIYFAIYPMAVLAAFALARLAGRSRVTDTVGWLVAALLVVAVRPAFTAPRPIPVVSTDLYAAGKWLRAQGGAACTDYLVTDAETAYWLHLAVLGNPRASARMTEIDAYEPRAAVGPWLTDGGRPFAIADLRTLPDEVRARVEVRTKFGNAAVIARPGSSGCP